MTTVSHPHRGERGGNELIGNKAVTLNGGFHEIRELAPSGLRSGAELTGGLASRGALPLSRGSGLAGAYADTHQGSLRVAPPVAALLAPNARWAASKRSRPIGCTALVGRTQSLGGRFYIMPPMPPMFGIAFVAPPIPPGSGFSTTMHSVVKMFLAIDAAF